MELLGLMKFLLLCLHLHLFVFHPLPLPLLLLTLLFINLFLFIYFWLRWVFVNVRGLSLVAASRGATLRCAAQASHCGGFSCCGAPALGAWASVVMARGLSSCGLRAVERRAVAL